MNKTQTAHIGGMVFHIEDPAFEKLAQYLQNLRTHFSNAEAGEEIIMDIESRIAELFSEYQQSDKRSAVNIPDVEKMISVMGLPEQFDDGLELSNDPDIPIKSPNMNTDATLNPGKRFYRNTDDEVISGVCSGLSAYFGIQDPIWLRLLFLALLAASFGFWFVVYIILSIIVPPAKTASEKLNMRGESVTVSNIEKTVKEGLYNIGHKVNDFNFKSSDPGSRIHSGVKTLAHTFIASIGAVGSLAISIMYWMAIFIASVVAVSILVAAFALFFSAIWAGPHLHQLFIPGHISIWPAYIGLFLLAAIPLALLISLLTRRLLKVRIPYMRRILAVSIALWFLGFILCASTAAIMSKEYRRDAVVSTNILPVSYTRDTLTISVINRDFFDDEKEKNMSHLLQLGSLTYNEDKIISQNVKFTIEKSVGSEMELIKDVKSKGPTRQEANRLAAKVEYTLIDDGTHIKLNPFFQLPKEDKYHFQEVFLTLKLPGGKSVYLDESTRDIIYDVKNTSNTWDNDMLGKTWTMTENGLSCIACPGIEETSYKNKESALFDTATWDTRNVSDFDEISLNGLLRAEIIQRDSFEVKIEPGRDEDITIEKKGDRLEIGHKDKKKWDWKEGEEKIKVYITLPALKKLKVTGLCNVVVDKLDEPKLELAISGASKVKLLGRVHEVNAEISGASSLSLNGTGHNLKSQISGASQLQAIGFRTSTANVELTGASAAEVWVSGKLQAQVSGASHLNYAGSPSEIEKSVSDFGKIEPINE